MYVMMCMSLKRHTHHGMYMYSAMQSQNIITVNFKSKLYMSFSSARQYTSWLHIIVFYSYPVIEYLTCFVDYCFSWCVL